MTISCHCRIAIVIAALVAFALADFPPVVITCHSMVLKKDDLPFYEEDSYKANDTVVFDYQNQGKVVWPFIYPLFATANFTVANNGTEDLTFSYTSSISNLTDNGAVIPSYMFEPQPSADSIPAGGSVEFVFGFQSEYESDASFSGILSVFMLFKDTSTFYDPVSFKAKGDLYVTGCPDECSDEGEGKGECITRVGYCKCEEPWTGVTCQSGLKILNPVVCPGEPINISYSFASTSCKGYWSIYDTGETTTTFGSGLLYTDDCVKDSVVKNKNMTIIVYLKPGKYRLCYFREYGVTEDGSIPITVRDWGECDTEYNCSLEVEDVCSGHGECVDHECECDESHFWQNCSRGCSMETRITARTAIIDSDSGSDKENVNPLYIPQTNCTWYIEPEGSGVDKILIEFSRFSFHSSNDVLWVRSLNRDGQIDKKSVVLGKFTGDTIPQSKVFAASKIALVFTTNYQGSSLGFRLNYTAVTDPLDGVAIAHIVVVCFIVLAGLVILFLYISRRRKIIREEALKFAKSAPSEPWILGPGEEEIVKADRDIGKDGSVPERFELEKILGWADMKDIEFECSEYDLRFGLEERVPCPVMVEQKQVISITNASDVPLAFCFFHPVENYTLECSIVPGKGTLAPGTLIRVQVTLKLMYTTRLDASIKCAVWRGARGPGDFYAFATSDGLVAPGPNAKPAGEDEVDPYTQFQEALAKSEPLKSARLTIHLEGAVSERIDPGEVVLNPEPLGDGADGVVYSGRYRGRFVAVKVMSRQHDLVEQITKDFEKEIDLYRRLHNPLIVEFIGASLIPGKLCMCTELIQRGSLEHLIKEAEIPLALQLRFASNIAEAVAFLHSNNVLYRDLKPSNVMVVSTSLSSKINCKIGDFGTARNVKDVTEYFLYTQGQGTPAYMAPEMLAVKPYNCKADVYSFAITLWQMASRDKPWTGFAVWDVPARVIHGKRPPMPEGLPKDYDELIRKCWSPKPDNRPAFSEIFEALAPIAKRLKKEIKKDGKGKHDGYLGPSESMVDFGVTLEDSKAHKKQQSRDVYEEEEEIVPLPSEATTQPITTTTTPEADSGKHHHNHDKKKKKKKKKKKEEK